MVGSAFAEKLASEYQGEEDRVVTLIVEPVDYDLRTEIEWTITTEEPGVSSFDLAANIRSSS